MIEVEFSKDELKAAIYRDCVVALSFYLQEELTLTVPQFHIDIWDELIEYLDKVNDPEFLIGHLQKLFAVPREHSKTTLIKIAIVIFMRYSSLNFPLYVSKTSTIALNAVKDIVGYFRSRQDIELYGEPTILKANESDQEYKLVIFRADGSRKLITLKAIGQGHQARGMLIDNKRPDLIVMDDIEDLDTADGGTQQKKLDEWVMGSLLKASAKRSLRIFLGNMVRSTTLLARLSKDPEWNPTVFGALVRDKTTGELRALWEGRWTVAALMADYRTYRKNGLGYIWETEMMNLSKDVLFTADLSAMPIVPAASPEDVEAGFVCLDPAFGQKAWNDSSAITVHVRLRNYPVPVLVYHRVGKFTENQIFDEMLIASYWWNIGTWCIESVAAQKLLIPLFRLLFVDRLMDPDSILMLPVQAGQTTKSSRIIAFRNACSLGSYAMTEDQVDVRLRLEDYSPDTKNHDDLCDSAAYGPVVWQLHKETITARGRQDVAGLLLQAPGIRGKNSIGELDVCLF